MENLLQQPEFLAAVAGAAVGGVIATILQLLAIIAAKAERKELQKQNDSAVARSLLAKLARAHRHIIQVGDYLASELASGRESNPKADAWQMVKPSTFQPSLVEFSSDEMSLLHRVASDDLFNLVLSLDTSHNAVVSMIPLYNRRRAELLDQLVVKGEVKKTKGREAEVSSRFPARLRSRMIELDSIIHHTIHLAERYEEDTGNALLEYASVCREKFGIEVQINLTPPTPKHAQY
jgi:hypothetical protein